MDRARGRRAGPTPTASASNKPPFKSTEGYTPIAVKLVQLGEFQDTEAITGDGTATVLTTSEAGLSIAAFTKKFSHVRQSRHARFQPGDLELLAYTDHLLTPWPVLSIPFKLRIHRQRDPGCPSRKTT